MWGRLLFWLGARKKCRGCCLGCRYYGECSRDVLKGKGILHFTREGSW